MAANPAWSTMWRANDEHAIAIVRDIVARLNTVKRIDLDVAEPVPPRFDPAEIYGIVPADVRAPYDVREVIARIVDGSELHENSRPLLRLQYCDRLCAHLGISSGYPRQ